MTDVTFLVTFICSILLVFACRVPFKKAPWVFYALALLLVVLFVGREFFNFPAYIERPIFSLMQKCTLAEALFVIVMYIGVLNEKSWVRTRLMPIRAELSILACLLASGHIISYLLSFVPQIVGSAASLRATSIFSICLAAFLVVLLIVLGVTSVNVIRRRMSSTAWKRIQWFAYPFFLLTYAHILLFLLPSALHGASTAQFSVAVYSVVFGGYVIARITAALRKRRATVLAATDTYRGHT